MIVESWTVSSAHGGTRRWFWVRVHSDRAAMLRAAYRMKPWLGKQFFSSDTAGLCHPVAGRYRDTDLAFENPRWPANGFAGTVRLVADNMDSAIIAHELVHAAAAIYRMNIAPSIDLGDGFADIGREEDFAYIYGGLAGEMDYEISRRYTTKRLVTG